MSLLKKKFKSFFLKEGLALFINLVECYNWCRSEVCELLRRTVSLLKKKFKNFFKGRACLVYKFCLYGR